MGECIYHVIANEDMGSSTDYIEIGHDIILRYPRVTSTDGLHPWVNNVYNSTDCRIGKIVIMVDVMKRKFCNFLDFLYSFKMT